MDYKPKDFSHIIFFGSKSAIQKKKNNRIKKRKEKIERMGMDESTSGIKHSKLQKPQKSGVINKHYGIKTT